jgi:acetate kinase
MNLKSTKYILTLNSGSSSIKFGLFEAKENTQKLIHANISSIGSDETLCIIKSPDNKIMLEEDIHAKDHESAIQYFLKWLNKESYNYLMAAGHRIVYGGPNYTNATFISEELMDTLEQYISIAPDHLPQQLKAIETTGNFYKGIKQIACFDTTFHNNMPDTAKLYALPRPLQQTIRKNGYHGLSYAYVMERLVAEFSDVAAKKIIIAHLGNGSSMVAVYNGRSIDTTMGFTPLGGLVMNERCGDIDPGVVLYLLQHENYSADELSKLLNHQSGVKAVAAVTHVNIKELLQEEENNEHIKKALDLFCYQAKKYIGALIAALGGLDILVFTGGIGENEPVIRKRICKGMEYAGIHLNEEKNSNNQENISSELKPAIIKVIKTDEEIMIAKETYNFINSNKKIKE